MTSSPPLRSGPAAGRRPEAGFTLIEMLIVLAVIGVASGAAMLGLGAIGRDNGAETEARRLAGQLSLWVDEAMLGDRDVVLTWDDRGYAVAAGSGGAAQRHDLPDRLSFAVQGFDAAVAGNRLIVAADATGTALRFSILGGNPVWHVSFDGYAATVAPGGAAG